ncbi:hypothetical protein GLOTRDRAFT_130607 [Gloeophyllum trabeum ATCC 11539]|uniref:Uncharacterized protein n=1 Tax=Gloeophyllum trabeum (strain ATCC 11539 / FP-39264 / Madison 617) TaxID=670483 RepID=S7Q432_GLOTA|nr:uncharacterized protein GLOTRDRAFT_130607 [Gloeophyllum trabeum ATCC 11539]EPQ54228.1 hypothetical protein GLOTRDRAFT_130607 [Gloeophyllum trabeum ATCC 11539]
MALRLPAHLESIVPPPAAQISQSKPWRGTFTIASDPSNPTVIYVSAAETDGDNRADLWPTNFFVHNTDRVALSEVTSWVQRHTPSLCMFMPDRLDYANDNRANEATFRSFSRMLAQNQMVAYAPWNSPRLPGAGILIYPNPSSSALLVGAIFLNSAFPDFLGIPTSPAAMYRQPVGYQNQYQNGQNGEGSNGYYQYM